MGRRTHTEFPLLKGLGLKTIKIRGDGNCLFRSLSDQLYGDQSRSSDIRAAVVEYMRENPGEFKPFVNVEVGGGTRRNPKRKNTSASLAPLDASAPTQEQINNAWSSYLQRMARNGEYGDNMELRAFTAAYQMDVRVYQATYSFYIKCGQEPVPGEERKVAHIALHSWEHYSSVRNLNGPDTGLPNVQPSDMDGFTITPDSDSEPSSTPSTPGSTFSTESGSSSILRDEDSEDEDIQGPNKRQARKEKLRKVKEAEELEAIPKLDLTTFFI